MSDSVHALDVDRVSDIPENSEDIDLKALAKTAINRIIKKSWTPSHQAIFEAMIEEEVIPPDADIEIFKEYMRLDDLSGFNALQNKILYLKEIYELSEEQAIVYIIDAQYLKKVAWDHRFDIDTDLPF